MNIFALALAVVAPMTFQTQDVDAQRKELFTAIQIGDKARIGKVLTSAPDLVKARTRRGSTLLQIASYSGHPELVPYLKKYPVEFDFGTALAVGDTRSLEKMLKDDPSLAQKLTTDGYAPLCLAAGGGSPSLVKLLLKYKADPDQACKDFNNIRPIHSAAFGRNLECVKLIVATGVDVNEVQDGNFTALDEAASNGDIEIVKFLVRHGAKVDIKTKDGKTAADLASKHPDVVKFLSALK